MKCDLCRRPGDGLIGALDSSLLSLPEINDYLVVARCYSDPKSVFYFPLFAAAGSVIGCRCCSTASCGAAGSRDRRPLQPRERGAGREGVRAFRLSRPAVPALLPRRWPFKIFVATAGGAREYPRWRFIVNDHAVRGSLAYYIEGTLAVFAGERVIFSYETTG